MGSTGPAEAGRGGMGAVYLCESGSTNPSALKVLYEESLQSPEWLRASLSRDDASEKAIGSEHIVRAVVFGRGAPELAGAPYLVMELCAAVT